MKHSVSGDFAIKRIFLFSAGSIALGLGFLGIFLPILPTTPFLILAAVCFLHSSKRLYLWLTGHRLLGPYIRNYLKYKAISKRAKIASLSLMWPVILTTSFLLVDIVWVKILLPLTAAAVSFHILRFPTLTQEMLRASGEEVCDED